MPSATKAALSGLYYTRAHKVLARLSQGVGAIAMLHRVEEDAGSAFAPNAALSITPAFLEALIRQIRELGYEIVSLDALSQSLRNSGTDRPLIAITFDDGYRDNLEIAYPILKKHKVPFTVYVPTDFPGGVGVLWWIALERIIAANDSVHVNYLGETHDLPATTTAQKTRAFDNIAGWVTRLGQSESESMILRLCERHGFDAPALTRESIMTWDEIRLLDQDPLVTIGAHTMSHPAVAKLTKARARHEICGSLNRLERELGARPAHFSFPYGDAGSAGPRDFATLGELGLKTGVTTRKAMLESAHGNRLTALPRLPINGHFQDLRYTEVLLSGLPFALQNGFARRS